ncbi:choice-of-anchor B family protein [Patiriisocius hiemis]|uniref:Choice-of-anchor B family protein n=1 Tax=Patiriisocius hiemis TaxID=3075604 RepID=A0ABU2YB40_9FLAO|nr:choice-of-anchor B family protein [Constantimarinum sp. W242]MDT0555413.1 choice-of-anchor B family protein [Constantimarinum sp. W242]
MKKHLLLLSLLTCLYSCSSDSTPEEIPMDDMEQQDDDETIEILDKAPCENGMASIYPCNGYDLLMHLDLEDFNAARGNDSWGWTDPDTGKEYAIMGLDNGTAFVDITGQNPVYLGKLPTATSASAWRDIKVYSNHAFIVSEATNHGMQVFDLTQLRNVSNPPQNFIATANYNEFGNAHNIVINEESGYAYAVGTQTFNGGPHFINIQDPLNPIAEGGYAMGDYSHDAQVVTYNGPDSDYLGKEILIGSNENEIIIADITDKSNPQNISTISYNQTGYTHQGWFTENQQYFILGDETDELNFGFNSRTLIFDFSDLDSPTLLSTYLGPTEAIDHNGYVKDNLYFLANYTAGLRVLDISNISSGGLGEIGFFDTYTENNSASFNGVWNVYPFFESGKIIISDINGGLFIVKKTQ